MALELQSLPLYVLAAVPPRQSSLDRGRAQIFRPGCPGLGHAALWLLAGLRLHRHAHVRRAGRAFRPAAKVRASLPPGALVGLVFIVAGLAFKLAAVPFHMWTPDVYEGAPSPVTAFLAAAPKVAAVGLIVRVLCDPFAGWAAEWQQVIVVVAIAARWSLGRLRRHRPEQHQAPDGLFRHRPTSATRWSASPPARAQAASMACSVYLAIYLVMTLGTFGCILHDAPPGPLRRAHRRPRRPLAAPADDGAGLRHLHVLAGRHPAAGRLLRQALRVPGGGRCRPHLARRARASSPASSAPTITCGSSS